MREWFSRGATAAAIVFGLVFLATGPKASARCSWSPPASQAKLDQSR
jgi:hypothetical protein